MALAYDGGSCLRRSAAASQIPQSRNIGRKMADGGDGNAFAIEAMTVGAGAELYRWIKKQVPTRAGLEGERSRISLGETMPFRLFTYAMTGFSSSLISL